MADATIHDLKVALCPSCGTSRLFYYEGPATANPIPIDPPNTLEKKDIIEDSSAFAVITSWKGREKDSPAASSIEDGTAAWTEDEHKGKIVDVKFKDGSDSIESHSIIGNTDTELQLARPLKGKHLLPANSSRPSGLFYTEDPPYYRIREDNRTDPAFAAKVKTKRWSNSEFICGNCQTVYTIP